jgi:uncharacterized surface protein with fasciclin (FAS1) repeats
MKTKQLIICAFLAFFGLTVSSCSNDDDPQPTTDNTITGIASRTSNLSLLVKALTKAGLAETLQGSGPFTVFAPTDQAFIDAGYTATVINNLNTTEVAGLKQVLLNHVVSGSVQSTGLTNNSYIKTLAKGSASATNTLSMYVSVSPTTGVELNGVSSVITTTNGTTYNIIASNGVIHTVDAIIGLPTIADHAQANPNFSTLTTLLTNQNLVSTLDGTASSPFTVFAPLNSAFDTATTNLYGGLDSAKKTAVLTYHVIAGANVLSNAIPASSPTFESGILNFSGTVITDEKNRQVNIVLTDVQCANGVIHAVDKVLLPNSVP